VNVWIDRFSYRTGERIRPYFQSEPGAYVTILRVTTTGEVRVLYPHRPDTQQTYDPARLANDAVPYSTEPGFYLNEPAGVGFVFAVATFEPFNYRSVSAGGRWSEVELASTSYEDPYTIVNRFINRTLPTHADYTTDYIQYEVVGSNRYRPYGYAFSDYDDVYIRCLSFYSARAAYYCRQYSRYGFAPYLVGGYLRQPSRVTPRAPNAPNVPSAPGMRKGPPKRVIPDPVTGDEGVVQTAPAQRSPSNEEAQRAWWDLQRRDAYRRGGGSGITSSMTPRINPQDPSSSGLREVPHQPGIVDVRREPVYQPTRERYQPPVPMATPRFEPAPVQRSEPRFERPREEPRVSPPPPPPPPAPVQRSDPAPREIHPAPPPPPPPPPRSQRDK
jgi:hypothetical protein